MLKALRKGDVTEVVLPIDGTASKLTLRCAAAGEVTIPAVKGVRAKVKADTERRGLPAVGEARPFEFEFFEPAWIFLGRNVSSYADVELVQLQTTLAFPGSGE